MININKVLDCYKNKCFQEMKNLKLCWKKINQNLQKNVMNQKKIKVHKYLFITHWVNKQNQLKLLMINSVIFMNRGRQKWNKMKFKKDFIIMKQKKRKTVYKLKS